jgi:hypothetical protein
VTLVVKLPVEAVRVGTVRLEVTPTVVLVRLVMVPVVAVRLADVTVPPTVNRASGLMISASLTVTVPKLELNVLIKYVDPLPDPLEPLRDGMVNNSCAVFFDDGYERIFFFSVSLNTTDHYNV